MNEMLTVNHDYSSPLVDRVRSQSQKWYKENIEKAREQTADWHRKKECKANPKWRKSYGGAPYENHL